MRFRLRSLATFFAPVALLACAPDGVTPPPSENGDIRVVVLTDSSFIDVGAGDVLAEGTNLIGSFQSLGYDTRALSVLQGDSLHAALAGARIFVIPKAQRLGNLEWWDTLHTRHIDTMLVNFVQSGGVLVNSFYPLTLDSLFGWNTNGSLVDHGNTRFLLHPDLATGTVFAGGPDSLRDNNATYYLAAARFPPNTLAPWQNDSSYAPMFAAPVGQGWAVWIGWDWYNAAPTGTQDGGWLYVAERLGQLP